MPHERKTGQPRTFFVERRKLPAWTRSADLVRFVAMEMEKKYFIATTRTSTSPSASV